MPASFWAECYFYSWSIEDNAGIMANFFFQHKENDNEKNNNNNSVSMMSVQRNFYFQVLLVWINIFKA